MKLASTWILVLVISGAAQAQLRILPDVKPQAVFGGGASQIEVRWQNVGHETTNANIGVALIQASSATAIKSEQQTWKSVNVQPGQTVLESAALNFPAVRGETRFIVQWIVGASNIVGRTEVLVYPTNLLARLKTLAGNKPLGVFDPADTLKPLLRAHAVEFQDLIENGTDKFRGKLAIFGPFESKSQMRASLRDDVRALAKLGVVVVWLLPPPEKRAPLKPSFRVVREAEGAVVVAAHDLVTQLAERPEAQLNLLRLAEEALHPTPLTLPETETSN